MLENLYGLPEAQTAACGIRRQASVLDGTRPISRLFEVTRQPDGRSFNVPSVPQPTL